MQAQASSRPTTSASVRTGCYVYAIIDSSEDREFGDCGLDGCRVYALSNGRLAAVVSDVPNGRIRPERRRLAAHHEVLKRLRKDFTLLPMTFGLIADNPKAIYRILSLNGAALAQQLRRVAGKVEMGLHVNWDVPNIFEFFVNTHAELRLLRDELFRGGREPAHNGKIELGRMFDRIVSEERAAQTARVLQVLATRCFQIKENKPRNEREVMNLACLVRDGAQKEFEEGVFEVARLFDNHYAFDFNGPWAPHNFVDVNLQLE